MSNTTEPFILNKTQTILYKRDIKGLLHGGGRPHIGEVTCGGSPYLSGKRDQVIIRDYTDRGVTSPGYVGYLTSS